MEIVGSFAFDTIYMRFLVICLLSGNFWFRFVGFFLNENLSFGAYISVCHVIQEFCFRANS